MFSIAHIDLVKRFTTSNAVMCSKYTTLIFNFCLRDCHI